MYIYIYMLLYSCRRRRLCPAPGKVAVCLPDVIVMIIRRRKHNNDNNNSSKYSNTTTTTSNNNDNDDNINDNIWFFPGLLVVCLGWPLGPLFAGAKL